MEPDPKKQFDIQKVTDESADQKVVPVILPTPPQIGDAESSVGESVSSSIEQDKPRPEIKPEVKPIPTPVKVAEVKLEQKPKKIEPADNQTNVGKEKIVNNVVRRIRTYKEDIAEAVRTQKASLTSIAAAEQDRRNSIGMDVIKKPALDYKKIGIIFGSITLIALGVGVMSYFVFFYEKEEIIVEQEIPSFIFVEEQKKIDITGRNAREILLAIGAERTNLSIPLGQIEHLYITETIQREMSEVTRIISAEEFLKSIQAQVSDAFLRSIEPDFMLGMHVFNQNQPFIIFKSNSYQHSFAGLLEWERTIHRDLSPFAGLKADPDIGVPIDPQTGEEIILRENFADRIIQNIDARVLLSETGKIEFLYAFPNQQTIIITTNENTLVEVITRLRSVRIF
jgi:hypothetical protein